MTGDVNDERKAVRRFFDQYNRTTARPNFGVQFTVIDWENYSTTGVGRPQELITAQTLDKYRGSLALVIGLMGQRFGTPTGVHESGTEEEFRWAMQNFMQNSFPEIKWFFRRIESFSTDPDEIIAAAEQWKKVQAFKASFHEQSGQEGDFPLLYYKEFTDVQNFRDVLQEDLEIWLNAAERPWTQAAPATESIPSVTTSQPSTQYYQNVIGDFQWLDIAGIDNDRSFRIPLSEMYVRLRVMLDEDSEDTENDHDGSAIDIQTALARYKNLVIVGDPGSGKSTFLRFIALMIARSVREHDLDLAQERLNLEPPLPIPIFVSLWDLADFARQKSKAKVQLTVLVEFMAERFSAMGNEISQEQLTIWLEEGLCALLFDGLDEVPTDGGRALVSRLVESCVETYPKNRYVITSRVRAYTGDTILQGDFVRCDIQPFNPDDRAEFLRNWTALLFKTPPEEVDTPGSDSAREFSNLIEAVEHNERIRTLAVNPLLLTVVAIVHWNRKRLPEQRVDLYDECVDVLLGQKKEAERIRFSHSPEMPDEKQEDAKQYDRSWVRKRFAEIALQIMLGENEEISKQLVIQLLAPRFLDRGAKDNEQAEYEAERFLDQQELRSGLLVSRRASRYRFVHLTFQEYLAAWSMATQATDDVFNQIKPHLREQKWFESLVLLGGDWARRSDDVLDKYIRFLLEHQGSSITKRAPVIALCANIISDVSNIAQVEPETRNRYEYALQDTLNAFDRRSGIGAKTQLEILEALAHLGNAVKSQLMSATRSAHNSVRSRSVELITPHLPDDDLFSLIYLLHDKSNATIRTYLACLASRDAVRTIQLLQTEPAPVSKLGDAISRMADKLITGQDKWDDQLWKIVSDCAEHHYDPSVCTRSLKSLVQYRGSEESTWLLTTRLADNSLEYNIRWLSLNLLVTHRRSKESTWSLLTRLARTDSDPRICQRAFELLAEHREADESTLVLATRFATDYSDLKIGKQAFELLAEHQEADSSTLALATRFAKDDSDLRVCRQAFKILAKHRGSEALTLALATRFAQNDSDWSVRHRCVDLLVEHQGAAKPTWLLVVRLAINDSDLRVRRQALNLLAKHRGTEQSIWTLFGQLIEEGSGNVESWEVLEFLVTCPDLPEPVWSLVVELVEREPDPSIRRWASELIAKHRLIEESTWTLLRRLVINDPDKSVRWFLLTLLAKHRGAEESTWSLITNLLDNDQTLMYVSAQVS